MAHIGDELGLKFIGELGLDPGGVLGDPGAMAQHGVAQQRGILPKQRGRSRPRIAYR